MQRPILSRDECMNNKVWCVASKKDAGGDEKLIIKFAWPYLLTKGLGSRYAQQKKKLRCMQDLHAAAYKNHLL